MCVETLLSLLSSSVKLPSESGKDQKITINRLSDSVGIDTIKYQPLDRIETLVHVVTYD